jgi:hypothetical protein
MVMSTMRAARGWQCKPNSTRKTRVVSGTSALAPIARPSILEAQGQAHREHRDQQSHVVLRR